MSCLLVWLLACALQGVDGIACSSPRSVLGSAGKRICAALFPHRKPERSYQLSRCDNVSIGHTSSAMY